MHLRLHHAQISDCQRETRSHFFYYDKRRNGKKKYLRMPNEAFFHWNPKLLGLGRQIGQINSGAYGVFSAELSAPILVQSVPCPCFPLFNHYFYKKLTLYIHIPNIYLGLGFEFEFGLQRIRDLAFVCSPWQKISIGECDFSFTIWEGKFNQNWSVSYKSINWFQLTLPPKWQIFFTFANGKKNTFPNGYLLSW